MSENTRETPDIHSSTDEYATRFNGEVGRWFLDVQLKGTFVVLDNLNSGSIIDVGGGHGQTAGSLLKMGFSVEVLGSDDSCSKRLAEFRDNKNFKFNTGNLTALSYPDKSFDVALSYRMMTHLDGWRDLVSELCRVADKFAVVDYPTFRSCNILSELLFAFKKRVEKNTRHYNVFHEKEVIEEFKKHGFTLYKRYPQFFFPMALHRVHKNRKLADLLEKCSRVTGLSCLFASPVITSFKRDL